MTVGACHAGQGCAASRSQRNWLGSWGLRRRTRGTPGADCDAESSNHAGASGVPRSVGELSDFTATAERKYGQPSGDEREAGTDVDRCDDLGTS